MNTLFELHKDGSVTVFHSSPGGQTKLAHRDDTMCQHCPPEVRRVIRERAAARLPDVRDEGE